MNRNIVCYETEDPAIALAKGKCVITGKEVKIEVRKTSLKDYYERGLKAQDAFPDLTPGQREFFISGCSEEGFDKVT